MSIDVDGRGAAPHSTPAALARLPLAWGLIAATVALAAVLLSLPLHLPVGPMYWDVVVYLDGAQRVLAGQMPSVDFFAPVGPLGYWLMALGERAFPRGQPLLLIQWMFLLVTLPPLLPVIAGIERQSRARAVGLLLPFLAFHLVPMNVEQYANFPGVDGYGIYNRQVTELLTVLAAALVFERRQRVLLFVIAWSCTALFLLKITGFAAAGLLCAFAFAAGRVRFGVALASLAVLAGVLLGLELATGFTRAYIADILSLLGMNEGLLLPRFLQAASMHFGIFGSGMLLVAMLAVAEGRAMRADAAQAARRPTLRALAALVDRDPVWLAAFLAVGLFFESQNTGGQAFIFLWPLLLAIVARAPRLPALQMILVVGLAAATALPPLVNVLHRTMRAAVGELKTVALPLASLGRLGAVNQKPEIIEGAEALLQSYRQFPETYQAFADARRLPSYFLYSDIEFQVAWLLSTEDGAEAIRAYEARTGLRFDTILSLNFVNPFPAVLGREAPRRVAIGADPYRAVPPPDAATLAAVEATDLVLWPRCPVTAANARLREIYAPALAGRVAVELSPCWTGLLRPGLARGG